jgi:RHS repeat-associated protein
MARYRVLVRTRRDGLCNTSQSNVDCTSGIERFVWAGDNILWELRGPGASTETADRLELEYAVGQEYGIVGYTHAGGVDRPLVAYKTLGGNAGAVVVPHMNWRGLFSTGTNASGGASTTPVEWPGFRTTANHSKGETQAITKNWMGSLLEGQRDAGGQMYMRNRYYDPAIGQFTQTDPIGLAGGLNTYGFAIGDPISYADPYGLKVCYEGTTSDIRQLKETTERATNTSIDLDEENCITTATPLSNGKRGYGSLQARLNAVIRSRRRIRVIFSSGMLMPASAIFGTVRIPAPGHVAYMLYYDTGRGFGCFGNDYSEKHTPESLLVHELLGHMEGPLWARTGLPPAERRANRVENEYHRAVGETPRCDWDTDRS